MGGFPCTTPAQLFDRVHVSVLWSTHMHDSLHSFTTSCLRASNILCLSLLSTSSLSRTQSPPRLGPLSLLSTSTVSPNIANRMCYSSARILSILYLLIPQSTTKPVSLLGAFFSSGHWAYLSLLAL